MQTFRIRQKLELTLFICTIIGINQTAQAQILECKDENGKKMFATVCPKGYSQAREVEILKPPTESKEGSLLRAKTMKKLLERDAEYRTRQEAKKEAEAIENDNLRKADNACYELRKKLKGLQLEGPYQTGKDREGNPIYMDDQTRADKIKELTDKIKRCPADPSANKDQTP